MRATPFAVTVILLSVAFAGCMAEEKAGAPAKAPGSRRLGAADPADYRDVLSKPLYDLAALIKENVKVASFDGKRMDNWVYRPKTEDGAKVPVFINFSPYWYNLAPSSEQRGDAFSRYMIDYFVPRGYAVVLSSVRGTGYSEGCFNIGGEYEMKDAVAVIEHFAKQPWSNGNVAAGGKSYDGTTPQGAAVKAPAALKAIFPVSGISELYKYNYKGGIPYGNGASFNTYYYAGESAAPREAQAPLFMADRVACPYLPEMQANGVGSAITGDYTPYWQERNYTKSAKGVKAALFFVHGFTDWNVKPDHILPWLNEIPADVPKKVWLHNWVANDRGSRDGHVYPRRDDWNETMLRFLDQTLKGIETAIFDEPSFQIQDSADQWRWEESWPPADATKSRYYLGSKDGRRVLDAAPPGAATTVAYTDGAGTGQAGGGNLCTQAASAQGFVRYESVPLEKDVQLAGVPVVHVQARTDRPLGEVIATLCEVPTGGTPTMINWGGLNFRHRVSLENPQPVVPDTVYDLQFPLFPQDDVVRAGSKLVLVVAGTGGQYASILGGNTVTVLENGKSWIEFTVDGTLEYEAPQPTKIPCFAC
ncbi:MAG: CocE/NonD family hydrolase [Euryarchaeota archaeon]|nr:CocE/NonD family hydrolase [Euryarchaeota archaeon]